MTDATVEYVAARVVQAVALDGGAAVVVTERTVRLTAAAGGREREIPLQIPENQRVEAAQIVVKGGFISFAAAVRLVDQPRVYMGYFQAGDGRLLNSTPLLAAPRLVLSSQIAFVPEAEYITVAYVLEGRPHVWRADQARQRRLRLAGRAAPETAAQVARDEYLRILCAAVQEVDGGCEDEDQDSCEAEDGEEAAAGAPRLFDVAYCVAAGAYLNRAALFVGLEDRVVALSAPDGYAPVAELRLERVPVAMAYHPALHQLAVLTSERLLLLYELGSGRLAPGGAAAARTRVQATAVAAAPGGYVLGDDHGRVARLRACRPALTRPGLERFVGAQMEAVAVAGAKEGHRARQQQVADQEQQQSINALTEAQENELKAAERLLARAPCVARVLGCRRLLAQPVLALSAAAESSIIVACSAHAVARAPLAALAGQDDELPGLGFGADDCALLANSARFYQSLSGEQLRAEAATALRQTRLEAQVRAAREQAAELSRDCYKIVQSYLAALSPRPGEFAGLAHGADSAEGSGEEKGEEESEKDKKEKLENGEERGRYGEEAEETEEKESRPSQNFRDAWTRVFKASRSRAEDMAAFVRAVQERPGEDPHADERRLGLDETAQLRMPMVGGLIVLLRKAYHKGIRQIDEVLYRLKPRLESLAKAADNYQNNDIETLLGQAKEALNEAADSLTVEVHHQSIKKLDAMRAHPAEARPLLRGTARKYRMNAERQQLWQRRGEQVRALEREFDGYARSLHAMYKGLHDMRVEELRQMEHFTRKDFISHFVQGNKGVVVMGETQSLAVAGRRVDQVVKSLGVGAGIDFREVNAKPGASLRGVLYPALELQKNVDDLVLFYVSPDPDEALESLEDFSEFNKQKFNVQMLELKNVIKQPVPSK